MGDHAVLRSDAHALDVPKTHYCFHRLDTGKTFVGAQGINQALNLYHGGQIAEQDATGFEGVPGAVDYFPRFG